MRETSLNQDEAAELFVELLIATSFDGALRGIKKILEEGPGGRKPRRSLVELHRWFEQLDNHDQQRVLQAMRAAADAAVFDCLALLDGVARGYPVEGATSDWALYLQIYEDVKALGANQPRYRVRINGPKGEFLHDIYRWILDNRESNQAEL